MQQSLNHLQQMQSQQQLSYPQFTGAPLFCFLPNQCQTQQSNISVSNLGPHLQHSNHQGSFSNGLQSQGHQGFFFPTGNYVTTFP
jgi:hypothetical protein